MIELTTFDRCIKRLDRALRTACDVEQATCDTQRPHPAEGIDDQPLSDEARREAIRLMRINHAGEIAAQGLYHGQSLSAHSDHTKEHMQHNAHEEKDHLRWCRQRVEELGGRVSLLTPAWYAGSVAIGVFAGLFGDRVSHAFVQETEEQVGDHLQSHLDTLSPEDKVTRAIIERIQLDEAEHAESSRAATDYDLPTPVKEAMRWSARIMTTTARWL